MTNVLHSSASNEHGTPATIALAAEQVMGGIDLDPASTPLFNEIIGAAKIFTAEDNGFAQLWPGRVFLNPPGGLADKEGRRVIRGRAGAPGCTVSGACGLAAPHGHVGVTSSAKLWWALLARSFAAGVTTQGIFVGFTLELLQSTQGKLHEDVDMGGMASTPLDHAVCYPRERLAYNAQDASGKLVPGEDPTHSSFIAYLTRSVDERVRFASVFSKFGKVVIPDVSWSAAP